MPFKSPHILDWLIGSARSISRRQIESLTAFKTLFDEQTGLFDLPIDRAVAGGFLADRIAYAFAAGYEAALRRLVPGLPTNAIVSLCITEREGGHPRAIKARLEKDSPGGRYFLTGEKTFITAALESEIMLVAASTGAGPDGKNQIRMVLVERGKPGVRVTPMAELPFVPEISHGVVSFTNVPVDRRDILPGDGYTEYIKPFRTIEDLHVLGAVMGHIVRIALVFSWPRPVCQGLLAQIAAVRTLAVEDPLSPAAHLALGGLMDGFDRLLADIEPFWDRTDAQTRARWKRDRHLLGVAQKAREARLSAAWARVTGD